MVNACASWCNSIANKSKQHDNVLMQNSNVILLNLISFLHLVAPAEIFLYGCYWDPSVGFPRARIKSSVFGWFPSHACQTYLFHNFSPHLEPAYQNIFRRKHIINWLPLCSPMSWTVTTSIQWKSCFRESHWNYGLNGVKFLHFCMDSGELKYGTGITIATYLSVFYWDDNHITNGICFIWL